MSPSLRWHAGCLVSGVLLAAAGPVAQPAPSDPLPSAAVVVERTRDRLLHPDPGQERYLYTETETSWTVAEDGTRTVDETKTFEIFADWSEGYRLLVAENGEPLSADRIEKQRREELHDIRRRRHERATVTESERRDRLDEAREQREDYEEFIDDAFGILEIEPVGREIIDGHSTVMCRLTPRPGVEAKSDRGDVFGKIVGTVWLSEPAFDLVRLEIEVTEPISYAWGLGARLREGASVVYEQRLVDGEFWLPARMHVQLEGRLLLLRALAIDRVSEYSGYERVEEGEHPLETALP